MKTTISKIICALIAILAPALTGCEPVSRHTEVCKVLSIQKQVETSGTQSSFSTDIYWLVLTDRGSYHLRTDGLWACPDAVGKLKEDSTYRITVDGWFSSSFWGIYPYIVKVDPTGQKGGAQ